MKFFSAQRSFATFIILCSILGSGCAVNMKVPIRDPEPSRIAYQKTSEAAPTTLVFNDSRNEADKGNVVSGTVPMQLTYKGTPFDAASWVAQHVVNEMTARGLPVSLGETGGEGTAIVIRRIHVENSRSSGFSPFITFTSLRVDVMTDHGPQNIVAYVKRGKVPVWSFDEVIEPTYNAPLGIATKEIAAKLNQQLFRQAISDEQIKVLTNKIAQDGGKADDAYLDVYQLGFGNNPSAIAELVKLSSHENEYIRLAAISSLGILKATDQQDFLIRIHENSALIWQDRAMALKAIGDLGTPESQAYLQKARSQLETRTDKDATWTRDVIALYL